MFLVATWHKIKIWHFAKYSLFSFIRLAINVTIPVCTFRFKSLAINVAFLVITYRNTHVVARAAWYVIVLHSCATGKTIFLFVSLHIFPFYLTHSFKLFAEGNIPSQYGSTLVYLNVPNGHGSPASSEAWQPAVPDLLKLIVTQQLLYLGLTLPKCFQMVDLNKHPLHRVRKTVTRWKHWSLGVFTWCKCYTGF